MTSCERRLRSGRSPAARQPALVLGLACLAIAAAAAPALSQRWPSVRPLTWSEAAALPEGPALQQAELARQHSHQARTHRMNELLGARKVSAKSRRWLAEQGLGPARLSEPLTKTAVNRTTLRILLVRISFETNRLPHLVTMAPDGDFMLGAPDPGDPLPIDPPPHDKAYFEAHLSGLADFYRFQSGGQLTIEARVLPDGDQDSYKLGDVADYGPGASGWWTLAGLESLVRDMIRAVDAGAPAADPPVDLSDYADDRPLTYIIFAHAGSDWQSDVNQDTPNDIPTFFISLGEPEILLGGGLLSECSVIPETTNQDGYRGSIAAALYHEFGHALGLPDVYNATTGLPTCGVWDLMDSGTNLAAVLGYEWPPGSGQIVAEAVTGLLPPSLSAWCRWFLGWLDTELIRGGEGQAYRLPAATVLREQYDMHNTVTGNSFDSTSPQALIGGASPREFFLVENRWVPRSVADTPYDPYDPQADWGGLYFRRDQDTGVVLYLAGDRQGEAGLNTGYYDYFLPEGGLLVWHVNMERIADGLADNTINRDGDGLRLVEADGIQDIGVLDAYVLGWYGSSRDPFAPWNVAGYTELFVQGAGLPTSRAYDRAWTGVRLWDIADDGQAHGAVMALRAVVEPMAAGWPVALPPAGDELQPQARNVDAESLTPLAALSAGGSPRYLLAAISESVADEPPLLWLWDADGEPAYPPAADLPAGAVLALTAPLAGPPAVIPAAAGAPLLVLGDRDGTVRALQPQADSLATLWSVTVSDSLLAGPQPVPVAGESWLILALDASGLGYLLDRDAAPAGEPQLLLAMAPSTLVAPARIVSLAAGDAVLLCHDSGWRLQPVAAEGFAAGASVWSGRIDGPAHVALVAEPPAHRLLIFGPGGLQGAWRLAADGAWSHCSWPDPGAPLVCEPAVADLDGDGRLDVIAATADRIFAWHGDGVLLTGFPLALADLFPLPAGNRIAGPLIVADLAAGPTNELAFATERGHLFVLGSEGSLISGTPFSFGDGGKSGLAVVPLAAERAALALASAGDQVAPAAAPRLASGRLALYGDFPLPADGPATAGWFGHGGGPRRGGPVGEARPVAGASAAAQGLDGVVFYPNPLRGRQLTVRFWSATDRPAELAIFTLQGEVVRQERLEALGGRFNEHTVALDVASGLYVARLTCERTAGKVTSQIRTVAVTR